MNCSQLRRGDVVNYDEVSGRYSFLRCFTVDHTYGRNVFLPNGDCKWWPDVKRNQNLRVVRNGQQIWPTPPPASVSAKEL